MNRITASLHLWESYWFRPGLLFNLAVVRILLVLFKLRSVLRPAYLEDALALTQAPDFQYSPLPVLKIFLALLGNIENPGAELLQAAYWITAAAGILALLGLFTNPSLLVFSLGSLFFQGYKYSFGDFHHTEALMLIGLLLISLAPSGRVLSLDELISRRQGGDRPRPDHWLQASSPYAAWPLLAIQWLLSLAYFSSAFSKVAKAGLDWMNGYTLQYYLVRDGLRWGSDLGVFIGQFHTPAVILSWLTVLFEATFFLVLIFPRLARIYIPAGIAFHTGVYLTMLAPFFSFMMLYSVFVPWDSLLRRLRRRRISYSPAGYPRTAGSGAGDPDAGP